VSTTLYQELGEDRLAPPQLLKQMIDAGHYGAKSGRGFYNYTEPSDEGDRRAMLTIEMARIFE
jgi:3-hydroxybutyryl-CoA dehydrogenase